jgi:hypothetical protein
MATMRPTPRKELLGLLSDAYQWMQSPERTQQMQGFAGLLGTTGLPQTVERMAYGEPLTNIGRANVPLLKPETAEAIMTVAPTAKAAGAVGKRVARMAGQEITDVMSGMPSRSLLGAMTPQPMRIIEKNPSPFIVKHGTNQPFDEFKSGMGVTAKHIYTTPEEYAKDAAKYGETLITAQASPKSLIDFSSESKLDKPTINALKKAAKEAGITDKYYPFESFMDDLMSGQLYQKGGGSRDQDALLSELFAKYQAVKMPDAAVGGGISKSVVFENPELLKIVPEKPSPAPQQAALDLAQQKTGLLEMTRTPSETEIKKMSREDLLTWLQNNDPNGQYMDPTPNPSVSMYRTGKGYAVENADSGDVFEFKDFNEAQNEFNSMRFSNSEFQPMTLKEAQESAINYLRESAQPAESAKVLPFQRKGLLSP